MMVVAGFSFMRDGAVDMRMDTNRGPIRPLNWLPKSIDETLANVAYEFGEERSQASYCTCNLADGPG